MRLRCAACGGTGYRGSIALFELLNMSEAIGDKLVARKGPQEIRDEAAREETVALRRDWGRRPASASLASACFERP